MANTYGHKIEIYPNNSMKRYFEQCFGYTRYCWNWILGKYYGSREEGQTQLTLDECNRLKTKDKKKWEYKMPAYIQSDTRQKLAKAIKQHFKPGKSSGMPNKKKKNRAYASFHIDGGRLTEAFLIKRGKSWFFRPPCAKKFRLHDNMKYVRLSEELEWDPEVDRICSVTISRDCDKYYASFNIEVGTQLPQSDATESVGIDPGVKTLATLSTGETFRYPQRKLKKLDKQIRKVQSHMGHSKHRNGRTGTNNWVKAKTKLIKLYQKVRFIKEDVIKKATTDIIKKYKNIAVEINDVSAMQQLNKRNPKRTNKSKHESNKNLSDASIYLFTRILEQKCQMRGTNFIKVSPRKASTQTCSVCGCRRTGNEKLTPKDRIYTCPVCGHIEDRDLNAAKNIHKFGMQTISPTQGNGSSSQ